MMKLREWMKQDKIDNDEETDEAVENDENDQLFIFIIKSCNQTRPEAPV